MPIAYTVLIVETGGCLNFETGVGKYHKQTVHNSALFRGYRNATVAVELADRCVKLRPYVHSRFYVISDRK